MASKDSDFDTWLDSELRDVPVPVGMLQRLRGIAVGDDEALDAAVRDVPVPLGLERRLQRIGQRRARLAWLGQTAVAASLVMAIGASYLGAMLAFLLTLYRAPGAPPPRLISQVAVELLPESYREESTLDGLQIALAGEESLHRGGAPDPAPQRPEFRLAAHTAPVYSPLDEMRDLFAGPNNPSGRDPLEDWRLGLWPVFAAPSRPEELPELRGAPGLVQRGVVIPPVDGADPAFLIQTGFNPFVAPGANPQLRTSVVPLAADTRTYQLARQSLDRGELPPPGALRTEDFLAAIDYQLPRPKSGPLALHAAGGPSPFWPPGRRILQIGVQARDVADGDRRAARLTLAVDVSASMQEGGRSEMVGRALDDLEKAMGPNDRVSLVSFSEEASVLAEDIGPDAMGQFLAAVDSVAVGGSTNIAAGLREAYAVAYHQLRDDGYENRVVLVTDALAHLDPVTVNRIEERVAAAAMRGIILHVVDVGDTGKIEKANKTLTDLALAGGGDVHRARSSDQVRWALREVFTGKSQLVACDVALKVTFNPRSVGMYRLLGHEAGEAPADLKGDFYGGQSATALYEVQLLGSPGKEVAVAELTWRDPASGRPGSATRTFSRGQFAPSMIEAPPSVQAAAVVAEAVEILRGSPFVRPRANPRSLVPVLEQARQLDTRLRESPALLEFMSLMEQAETAKPHRSGG